MNKKVDYQEFIDPVLYMNWLRPENVLWDVHAATLIAPHLRTSERKMEIGIGNGCTSFTLLGGKFKDSYDWYYNVDIEGFWSNKDIYDSVSDISIGSQIESYPDTGYELVVDHKKNLIDQTRQLKISKEYRVGDANNLGDIPSVDVIFSNILYWLKEPAKVFGSLSAKMRPGAKLVTALPNSRFFKYCRSYTREDRFWTLINRGRADLGMWGMDEQPFADMIANETDFLIQECRTYLSPETLAVHDIGLRPFSPYLIEMANSLAPERRLKIKRDWCEGLKPLLLELLDKELRNGPGEGGFNFYVLKRKP